MGGSGPEPLAGTRWQVGILAAALLWAFAYFYQAGGWNQNSRFNLVRSIVEQGSIRIDAYHRNTGDKAKVGPHFYSDKAPGLSLAAVPAVAALRHALDAYGTESDSRKGIAALSYAATVTTAAVPSVLAAVLLFWVAIRLGASRHGAGLAAIIFGLGTPAWAYATLFMGHGLATGCLFAAFTAAVAARTPGSARRDVGLGLAVGLAAGWSVVTEYPVAPAAVIVACLTLVHVWPHGKARILRVGSAMTAAALACLGVLLIYQHAAFGSAFETPLRHLYLFPHVKEQPFTWPRWSALTAILVGSKRGLLPLAPVLALAPLGLWLLARSKTHRATAVAAGAVVIYFFAFNAAFATPLAGWSYGPRYVAAALPFLALPLAFLWSRARAWLKVALLLAAAWGVFHSLVAVATTAQPPESFKRPMWQLLWPAFRDGDLSLNHQSFLEAVAYPDKLRGGSLAHDAWNLGEFAGLSGHASLVPLYLGFIAAALAWWQAGKH